MNLLLISCQDEKSQLKNKDKALKENFVDNQSLLVIIDWTFPGNKDNEEVIQQKLDEFMRKMEQRER